MAGSQRCLAVLAVLLALAGTSMAQGTFEASATLTFVSRGKQFNDADCSTIQGLTGYFATVLPSTVPNTNPAPTFLRWECRFNNSGVDPLASNVRTSTMNVTAVYSLLNGLSIVLMKQLYDSVNNQFWWQSTMQGLGTGCNAEGMYSDFFQRFNVPEDPALGPAGSTTQRKVACTYVTIGAASTILAPGQSCDFIIRTIFCQPPPPQ
eukprot:CAMPEP_0202868832 /NCGR_PEP_ID=MMETSP1391-20130828/11182_1 /ASSEMBLY_ACC=CAM_ASM_000867 /TAXON_ID=1034604 /ORGANISM="Chlamydomonas leiostraca, Strain SAG 11-49" /LENGTH=206 /DNA_ID=CAMNT_0049549045 /DNA_START=279 /DNA_END=896 /DNA_ORIENTATION=+